MQSLVEIGKYITKTQNQLLVRDMCKNLWLPYRISQFRQSAGLSKLNYFLDNVSHVFSRVFQKEPIFNICNKLTSLNKLSLVRTLCGSALGVCNG